MTWVNLPPRGKARRQTERAGTALSEDKNSFEAHSHESGTDSRKLVRNGPENLILGPRGPSGSGWLYQVGGSEEWPGPPTIILKCCGLQSRPQDFGSHLKPGISNKVIFYVPCSVFWSVATLLRDPS